MKKLLKKYWIFILFVIPFVFICFENKTPDNDIWFLLTNGRYVFEHGIPNIDPFTIHEGLSLVMQQWGAAAIFWGIYKYIGHHGLLIFIYVISFLLMIATYKLYYRASNNRFFSVIFTTFVYTLIYNSVVLRPQVFTFLILVVELYLLESYVIKKNSKYLYVLPFLSILLVNLHASMWYFQFVFILPFLLNAIKIKKVTIDKVRIKPLLVVIVLMIIGGFLNPYGYEALTFIFKSYGISEINSTVSEMKYLTFESIFCKVALLLLFLMICICNYRKDLKMDIRHFLFVCGTTILLFMHIKCAPYFFLVYFYSFSYLVRKLKIKHKIFEKRVFKATINGLKIGLIGMLIFTFIYTCYYSIKGYSFKTYLVGDITDYLLEHYNKEDIRLYVDFNNGGYTEFMGIKSYIDGRAELFFEKFNDKEDIFSEYKRLREDYYFDYEKFLKKYNFTHLYVYEYEFLDIYMKNNDDYEVVYVEYFDEAKTQEYLKLYARKDLEVKK